MSNPGTTEWTCICKDCSKDFRYSDTNYKANALRGFSRPERCPECRAVHSKEVNTVGQPYFTVKPLYPGVDHDSLVSFLGKLDHPPRRHRAEHVVPPGEPPDKFGIKDDKIIELFRWFTQDPGLQVVVVVGPTGSGKSTYFPYRLVYPPRSYEVVAEDGTVREFDASDVQPDLFHRYGQIVVTQPRIQATRGIPGYIAKAMLGSSLGAGFDIGYQHAGNPASDWRSKLRFCTDGSLINWIATGQLDKINTVMIDEAHERSLNIDIIIGLLTQALPRHPRLKLIIASATISADRFIEHFRKHLPKRAVRLIRIGPDTRERRELQESVTETITVPEKLVGGGVVDREWYLKESDNCELMEFDGKSFRVDPHFHDGPRLDYAFLDPDPDDDRQEEAEKVEGRLKKLAALAPDQVAQKAVEILRDMYLSADERERSDELRAGKGIRITQSLNSDGTPVDGRVVDVTERRGDVLGFLQGEREILECCDSVKKLVGNSFPCRVEALPLYTTLPQSAQDKALQERKPGHHDKLVARIRSLIAGGARDLLAVHDNVGQFDAIRRLLEEGDDPVLVSRFAGEDAVTITESACTKREGVALPARDGATTRVIIASSRALAVWDVPYVSSEEGASVALLGETFAFVPQEEEVRRVVVSTNVAETSLTIHGILHVVDSGLIKQNKWVPETETTALRPILQSRAGCKQRWGRAGRLQAGDAWPLYTREQFGLDADVNRAPGENGDPRCFPYYSQPEIRRSPLEQVLLTAKKAGLESLDVKNFPWLEAPNAAELERAEGSLVAKGALDGNGRLTHHGLELSGFQAEPRLANLMVIADRMACAVEMATVLAALTATNHQVKRKLLLQDPEWDEVTRRRVRDKHELLVRGCRDDLELVLKIVAGWELARSAGAALAALCAWHDSWDATKARVLKSKPDAAPLLDQLSVASEEGLFSLRPKPRSTLREVFDTVRLEATRGARARKRWSEAAAHWSMLTGLEEFPSAWRASATEESRIECVAEEILEGAVAARNLGAFLAALDRIEARSPARDENREGRTAEELAEKAETLASERRELSERFLATVSSKIGGREEAFAGQIERVVPRSVKDEDRKDEAFEMIWRNLEGAARDFTKKLGPRFRVPREDHPGRGPIEAIEAARSLDELRGVEAPPAWLERMREALPAASGKAWCASNFVDALMISDADKIDALRDDLIDSLSGHKKEDERRPINFALLDRLRILFAHGLSDHCYELQDGALRPICPGANELSGEIDRDSLCVHPTPQILVCTSRRALPPSPSGERKLGLGFVVSLELHGLRLGADLIRGTADRSPLANWSILELAALTPPLESDAAAIHEATAQRDRFLIDHFYPLHSRWSFRLLKPVEGSPDEWETEPTFVAPAPSILPTLRSGVPPTEDPHDDEGAGGDFTTSTFAGETPDPVLDLESTDVAIGGPRRPLGPGAEMPQSRHLSTEHQDREAQTLFDQDAEWDAGATPPPVVSAPPPRGCRVRLLQSADEPALAVGAEVDGWILDAEVAEGGASLTAGTRDPADALSTLKRGAICRVQVLRRGRAAPGTLRVRVVGTQALATMSARDLGFRDDTAVVDALLEAHEAAGSLEFEAAIWELDAGRGHLRVTTWPAVVRWLAENGYPERGVLVASNPARPDRVSVILHSQPEQGLVIAAEARAEQFTNVPVGSEVSVCVSRPRDARRPPTVRTTVDLTDYTEALFEEHLATRKSGSIRDLDTEAMSLERRAAILAKGPDDDVFRAAIDQLFEQSNQLYADERDATAATARAVESAEPFLARITAVQSAGVELEPAEESARKIGMRLWMDGRAFPNDRPDWLIVGRVIPVRPTGQSGGAGQLPVTCLPPPGWASLARVVRGIEDRVGDESASAAPSNAKGLVLRADHDLEAICPVREVFPEVLLSMSAVDELVDADTCLPVTWLYPLGDREWKPVPSHKRLLLHALKERAGSSVIGQVFRGRIVEVVDNGEMVLVEFGPRLRAQCPAYHLGLGRAPESHLADARRRLASGDVELDFEVTEIRSGYLQLSRQGLLARQLGVTRPGDRGAVLATVVDSNPQFPFVNLRVADFVVAGCHVSEFGLSPDADPALRPAAGERLPVIVEGVDDRGNLRASRVFTYYRMFAENPPTTPFLAKVKRAERGHAVLSTEAGFDVFAPGSLASDLGPAGSIATVKFHEVNRDAKHGFSPIVVTTHGVTPGSAQPLPTPPPAPDLGALVHPGGRTDLAEIADSVCQELVAALTHIQEAVAAVDAAALEQAITALRTLIPTAETERCPFSAWASVLRRLENSKSSFVGSRAIEPYGEAESEGMAVCVGAFPATSVSARALEDVIEVVWSLRSTHDSVQYRVLRVCRDCEPELIAELLDQCEYVDNHAPAGVEVFYRIEAVIDGCIVAGTSPQVLRPVNLSAAQVTATDRRIEASQSAPETAQLGEVWHREELPPGHRGDVTLSAVPPGAAEASAVRLGAPAACMNSCVAGDGCPGPDATEQHSTTAPTDAGPVRPEYGAKESETATASGALKHKWLLVAIIYVVMFAVVFLATSLLLDRRYSPNRPHSVRIASVALPATGEEAPQAGTLSAGECENGDVPAATMERNQSLSARRQGPVSYRRRWRRRPAPSVALRECLPAAFAEGGSAECGRLE